jgi:hypothetical protein
VFNQLNKIEIFVGIIRYTGRKTHREWRIIEKQDVHIPQILRSIPMAPTPKQTVRVTWVLPDDVQRRRRRRNGKPDIAYLSDLRVSFDVAWQAESVSAMELHVDVNLVQFGVNIQSRGAHCSSIRVVLIEYRIKMKR